MKRGTLNRMMDMIWNLWTATEVKIGCLFSICWLSFDTLVGGVDDQIIALVTLVSFDVLTGIVASFKTHSFMSSIATKGYTRKLSCFSLLA